MKRWLLSDDTLSGAAFTVVGLAGGFLATGYRLGTLQRMGPGFFPIIVCVGLVAVGLFLIARSIVSGTGEPVGIALRPFLVVLAGLVVFVMLVEPLGLLISTFLLVLVSAGAAYEPYRWRRSVILAAVLSISCIILFGLLLGQQLPIFGPWLGRG
jgi:hypothetical protein